MTLSLTSLIYLLQAQPDKLKPKTNCDILVLDETITDHTISVQITLPKYRSKVTHLCKKAARYKNGRKVIL